MVLKEMMHAVLALGPMPLANDERLECGSTCHGG